MQWKVWQGSGPRDLPDDVQKAIASQFHLDPSAMAHLKLVGKHEPYAGRQVYSLQVYAPALVNGNGGLVKAYGDATTHPEALMFEGRIETGGKDRSVFLVDRRPPVRRTPLAQKAGQR